MIVGILVVATFVNFPLAHIGREWVNDVNYHLANNSTWLNMTSSQKLAWSVIPGYYLIGLLVFYWTGYKTRRKRLFINKMDEGTVMYIHGIDEARGNIYDLACILFNGFRHMDWKDVPRPLSGDYYGDAIVLYYKTNSLVMPWNWKRRVLANPDCITLGVYSIWLTGHYERVVHHPFNSLLDFRILFDEKPYVTADPDHERFERYYREMLNRISITNNTLLQGNPSIMGQSVKNNLTILTKERVTEELEMLNDEEKMALYLEIHGKPKAESVSR